MNSVLKRIITALGLALGLVGSSVSAMADYQIQFINVSPGDGNAGRYNWKFLDSTGGPSDLVYSDSGNKNFATFCIQKSEHVSNGNQYTIGSGTFRATTNS